MSEPTSRHLDLLSILLVLATTVVLGGTVLLGSTLLAQSDQTPPAPTPSDRAVLSVPTRAPTPTRFASPTPKPTSTRGPTSAIVATASASPRTALSPTIVPGSDVARAVVKSVVQVRATNTLGTGFRVEGGTSPRFVTSARVVDKAPKVTVVTADGVRHTGTVARRDTAADLALVTAADLSGVPALKLAADAPKAGDTLLVVGYALGADLLGDASVTRGVVSGRRTVGGVEYLQTDAATNPGYSGGPVVSIAGAVVGVAAVDVRDSSAQIQGTSFAVPASIVRAFLDR